MQTLLLNDAWDIEVDKAGNIATTTGSYATAQTAANAIRLSRMMLISIEQKGYRTSMWSLASHIKSLNQP